MDIQKLFKNAVSSSIPTRVFSHQSWKEYVLCLEQLSVSPGCLIVWIYWNYISQNSQLAMIIQVVSLGNNSPDILSGCQGCPQSMVKKVKMATATVWSKLWLWSPSWFFLIISWGHPWRVPSWKSWPRDQLLSGSKVIFLNFRNPCTYEILLLELAKCSMAL